MPHNQLSTGSRGTPTPTSPKADDQLKVLQEELAKMRDELEAKKSENLDFRQKLTTAENHLATSQGEVLHVQQQLGEDQQAAADSAQKAEEYQQAVREAEEQSQRKLDKVQKEVERYQAETKELEAVAASVSKRNQNLDLKVLRAQDESKRLAEERDCQAHRIADLDGHMKGIAIHHNTLLKEEADKAKEAQLKWREEAAQRQALQQSVKDWEE